MTTQRQFIARSAFLLAAVVASLAVFFGITPTAAAAAAPVPVSVESAEDPSVQFECDLEGTSFNARICVDLRLQSGYVTCGEEIGPPHYVGHMEIWGPGGMHFNSADEQYPGVCGHGIGHGQTCAQFWQLISPGNYRSYGLACKDI